MGNTFRAKSLSERRLSQCLGKMSYLWIKKTANYQRGAIEFAKAHGISLVRFTDSELDYAVKAVLVDAIEMTIDEDDNSSYEIICSGNVLMRSIFDL
jgi:hypothetical protein